jgi:RimJ/RimL family protein N-acetyltransferase
LIPVGRPVVAWMRPLATRPERIDPADVRRLTEWRNRFVSAFLTEFMATDSRTTHWIADHVGPSPRKILFMLDDPNDRTFAYMGLDQIDWTRRYGEVDAIVRGEDAPRGVMTIALQTLVHWAQCALGLRQVGVRVRSDNSALRFYEKCGFVEVDRVPLHREEEPAMARYVEGTDDAPTLALVYMKYRGRSVA